MTAREDVFESMRGYLSEHMPRGLEPDTRPGSAVRTLLEVMTDIMVMHQTRVQEAQKALFIDQATGVHLDMHGARLGVERRRNRASMVGIRAVTDTSLTVGLAAGTRLYAAASEAMVALEVANTAVSPAGSETLDLEAIMVGAAGPEGLVQGASVVPESPVQGLVELSVSAPPATVAGVESDESYRLRMLQAAKRSSPSTLGAFADMVSVIPGIRASHPYNDPAAGPGVATILLEVAGDQDTELMALKAARMMEPFRPAGIRIMTRPVWEVYYDVTVRAFAARDHKVIRGKIRQGVLVRVQEYFEGLGLGAIPSCEGLRAYLGDINDLAHFSIRMARLEKKRPGLSIPPAESFVLSEVGPDARARVHRTKVEFDSSSRTAGRIILIALRLLGPEPMDPASASLLKERAEALVRAKGVLNPAVNKEIEALSRSMSPIARVEVSVSLTDASVGMTERFRCDVKGFTSVQIDAEDTLSVEVEQEVPPYGRG